jgi:hypothetical protein
MSDSRLKSRLGLAAWLTLMLAFPVGRYAVLVREQAIDVWTLGPKPVDLERWTTFVAIWIIRTGDLLLFIGFIGMWRGRSARSYLRTECWRWRIIGLALILVDFTLCTAWHHRRLRFELEIDSVCVELLAPTLVLVLLPVACPRRFLAEMEHHCQNCDYNLKGNVSGICPECGVPIQKVFDRFDLSRPL